MSISALDLKEIIDGYRSSPVVVSTRRQSHLYPSSASIEFTDEHNDVEVHGSCLRQQYYQYKGVQVVSETEARIMRIRDMGDCISEMFVDDFKRAGLYVADEVSLYIPKIGVSGRFDIMIKDPYAAPKGPQRPHPKHLIGVEIKSIGGYYNIKGPIKTTRDTPLAPKIEHVLQSMIYLDYYSQYGLKKWLIIYVDRESLAWVPHTLTLNENGAAIIQNEQQNLVWDHVTMAAIEDRYQRLWHYIQNDELPPRDYVLQYSNSTILKMYTRKKLSKTDSGIIERKLKKGQPTDDDDPILSKGDWRCNYCDFSDKCWSNDPDVRDEPPKMAMNRQEPTRQEQTPSMEDFV